MYLRSTRTRSLRVFLLHRDDNHIQAYSTKNRPVSASAEVLANYNTGEIPLDKVQEAFSKMELENIGVIGKRPRCTGSRLVVYNQQARGMSGRRTMAV